MGLMLSLHVQWHPSGNLPRGLSPCSRRWIHDCAKGPSIAEEIVRDAKQIKKRAVGNLAACLLERPC